MTWTWDIDGLGTDEQTIRIFDSDGIEVYNETRDGWSWIGPHPDIVDKHADTSPQNIERVQS
jgi:hypothetical protein